MQSLCRKLSWKAKIFIHILHFALLPAGCNEEHIERAWKGVEKDINAFLHADNVNYKMPLINLTNKAGVQFSLRRRTTHEESNYGEQMTPLWHGFCPFLLHLSRVYVYARAHSLMRNHNKSSTPITLTHFESGLVRRLWFVPLFESVSIACALVIFWINLTLRFYLGVHQQTDFSSSPSAHFRPVQKVQRVRSTRCGERKRWDNSPEPRRVSASSMTAC